MSPIFGTVHVQQKAALTENMEVKEEFLYLYPL